MISKLKYIAFFIIAVIGIDFSAAYLLTGKFVFRQILRTKSMADSRERGLLHEQPLEVNISGDSLRDFQHEFELWLDILAVDNQIGISPFHFKTIDEKRLVFNVQPIKVRRNWLVSFNDGPKKTIMHKQDHVMLLNDSLTIRFYSNNERLVSEIGTVVVR